MTHYVLAVTNWFDFSWIKNKISNYVAGIERNSEIKNTIKELQALSDAELRDIGISRGDIYAIAHEVYYDDLRKVEFNRNLKGWV